MQILIADDDAVSRRMLEARLTEWGFEVKAVADGTAAWEALRRNEGPSLAILDWMMPGLEGLEVCRLVRGGELARQIYLILLTARGTKADLVNGLDAGADDFIAKPFDVAELRARVRVGARVAELQASLRSRVTELEAALARVRSLQGLLPICSYCKKIRDDKDYWHQVETYVADNSGAQFSHGICPECFEKIVQPQLDQLPPLGR